MLNLLLSFIYSLGRFALGLLLHPYQSMQLLTEHKMFIWLTLLPTAILGLLTLLVRLLFLVLDNFVLLTSCPESAAIYSFLSTFIITFCIYWQLMLFYLLVRFKNLFNSELS